MIQVFKVIHFIGTLLWSVEGECHLQLSVCLRGTSHIRIWICENTILQFESCV